MHPDDSSEAPSPLLNFDFDYSTAWDSAPGRKVRRQYGKTNSQKKEAARRQRKRILSRSASIPLDLDSSEGGNETDDVSNLGEQADYAQVHPRPFKPTGSSSGRGLFRRSNSFSSSSTFLRSSSSSLSNSTDMEREMENSDPNVIAQVGGTSALGESLSPAKDLIQPKFASLSTVDEHLKARPRKIRALIGYSDLQRSFSDLAREAHATTAWDDATPKNEASLKFDLLDNSPQGSVSPTISMGSRKRGVCLSDGLDDLSASSLAGDSSSRRSKSRSRIFSPDNFATSVVPLKESSGIMQSRSRTNPSDSDDEGTCGSEDEDIQMTDVDKSMDSVMVAGLDEVPEFHEVERLAQPPRTFRKSNSANFEETVFGASSAPTTSKVLSQELIIHSMPSADDLKFLIMNLRKEKISATKSFGQSKMWTVALPSQWTSERRTNVLRWSTKELGFSVRTGGPSVMFLNIAAVKAVSLLSQLEDAFVFHQNTSNAEARCKVPPSNSAPPPFLIQNNPTAQGKMSSSPHSVGYRGKDIHGGKLDDALLQAVNKLDINAPKQPKQEPTEGNSPLVRLVTLETTYPESLHNNYAHTHPRHSGEHAIGGKDLVNHMHVVSPRRAAPSFLRRSLKTALSLHTEAHRLSANSPFVQRMSTTLQQSFECIETPHMTRRVFWEKIKNGRDWGASIRCSDHVAMELLGRLENALNAAADSLQGSSSLMHAARESDELNEDSDSDTSSVDKDQDMFDEDLADLLPGNVHDRRSSVGASAFAVLDINAFNDMPPDYGEKQRRRRMGSMAKHKRVSLYVNTIQGKLSMKPSKYHFACAARLSMIDTTTLTDISRFSFIHPRPSFVDVAEPIGTADALADKKILLWVMSFLSEEELLCNASPVCSSWADVGVEAHAALMLASVGCSDSPDVVDDLNYEEAMGDTSIVRSMEQPWKYLVNQYPWACFLSEGAFKRVYKVWNISTGTEEAISVMDVELIESTGNKNVVGAELAVSAMLSSLVRRNVCPNFVLTRRVFTCPYEPPASHWGSEDNKKPLGARYSPNQVRGRKPREPQRKNRGRYQYMRMELCSEGDAEEYLKRQSQEVISSENARRIVFQVAFALYAAADRFCLKHYDLKLLNIFLQRVTGVKQSHTTLRYGLGSHTFSLRMPTKEAMIAKLADYGTANVQAETNGQQATIGQFTTLENTPPEFMILGDAATQGHQHDAFCLGLCMLHLFTGHAPYEEILEDVKCPPCLKKKLQRIWEDENVEGYSVIQSVILADVCKDDNGDIIDGESDGVLYDTLYRFLVLFGVPEIKYKIRDHGLVWKAIISSFDSDPTRRGRARAFERNCGNGKGPDASQFEHDRSIYSIQFGSNEYIARARRSLEQMEGGMELLLSLVEFNPEKRASACDVLNSQFMMALREDGMGFVDEEDNHIMHFMAFATK